MKTTSLPAVEERLSGIGSVAIGGMLLEQRPNALVRALHRSGARDLFVTSAPAASWDVDLLVGTGRVARMRVPHVSLGVVGLAPSMRRAGEQGLVIEEADEALLLGGYLAANHDVAAQLLENMGTNDVVADNPLVTWVGDHPGVGPLRVNVVLLHAPIGDSGGNLVHHGSRWADLLLARSADRVIAQVDRLVPAAQAHGPVTIPGYLVDDVVEVPYGAHPVGCVRGYVADLDHLAYYAAEVAAGRLGEYVDSHVAVTHDEYLATVGHERLDALTAEAAA